MKRLIDYNWPGNIRELENVISRAAILCDGEQIRSDDLELVGLSGFLSKPGNADDSNIDARAGRSLKALVDDTVRRVERRAIVEALEKSSGSPTKAAKLLGISRASIYNKIKEYQVEQ